MIASKIIRVTPQAFDALMKHAKEGEYPATVLHRLLGLPHYSNKRGRKPGWNKKKPVK